MSSPGAASPADLAGAAQPAAGRRRTSPSADTGVGDARDHDRRGDPGAGRRLRGRAAGEGRVGRGGRRPGGRDARPGHARAICRWPASTSSAPAATARTRSTSRRWRRSSWPRPGVPVAKHGDRAASSSSGAADVLEELGVAIDLPAAGGRALRRRRPASASSSRRSSTRACGSPAGRGARWASPTVFNFLGPLTNPARPVAAAIGCADRADGAGHGRRAGRPRWPGAGLPRGRRPRRADHRDHVVGVGGPRRRGRRPTGSTRRRWASRPSAPDALRGGSPAFNAEVFRRVLGGRAGAGARRRAAQRRRRRWPPSTSGRARLHDAVGAGHGAGRGRRGRRAGGGAAGALGAVSRSTPAPPRLNGALSRRCRSRSRRPLPGRGGSRRGRRCGSRSRARRAPC